MRNIEKFSQTDAIETVTNIRSAEDQAKTYRALASANPDKKIAQALNSLAARHDVDAIKLAEKLVRRFESRVVGENREALCKLIEAHIDIFPTDTK